MQKVPTFENGKAAGAIANRDGSATGLGGIVSSRRRYAWLTGKTEQLKYYIAAKLPIARQIRSYRSFGAHLHGSHQRIPES
jgi:hypothetical protein